MAKAVFKKGRDKLETKHETLWDIHAETIDGDNVKLGDFVGGKKCIMVVNVASK